ncbi:LuxR family transcriptional regulator OS=Streptomyces alboniger OX=132473 GN=CP975_30720 PE=4 SV=1 [Streptomyces alboniger]
MQAAALRGAVALGPARAADRFGVCAATLSFVAQLAEDRPLLLVVDDAHALDAPSAEALAFAARRLMAECVAVLVATRPETAVDRLLAALPVVEPARLDDGAVAAVVADRSGVRPTAEVGRLLTASSGGNPMALIELVSGLTGAQLSGGSPMPRQVVPGATAEALFAGRVRALGAGARTLLLLMAAARGGLRDVTAAARALDVDPDAYPEAERSGLVSFGPDTYEFTHPLVAAAVLATTAPERRRVAHRALADVCAGPALAGARARHLAEAALGPDREAADALEELAVTARSRSGYAAAAAAWQRAAELSEEEAERARRLTEAAKDALLGGRSASARELLLTADRLVGEPGPRADIAAGLVRVELYTGHPETARRIVVRAADGIRDRYPLRAAELLADAAVASLLAGDPGGALGASGDAEKLLDGAAPGVSLVTGVIHGLTLLYLGEGVAGREKLRCAMADAERCFSDGLAAEYVALCAMAMTWTGEHGLARRTTRALIERLRASGAMGVLPFALYASARAELLTGRTDAALAAASEAVELSAYTDNELWQYLSLSALAHAEAVRGDVDGCRAHAGRAIALRRPGTDYPHDAAAALGHLELSLGDAEAALRSLRDDAEPASADGPGRLIDAHFDTFEAVIRAGLAPSRRMLADLAHHAGQEQLPLQAAIAWRLRGLLAPDTGMAPCFERALDLHTRTPCPLESARTRLVYGERLRRAGQRIRAREQLRAALSDFTWLRATAWAERARRELTATGERVRARAPEPSGSELTPQEFRVAQAVVRGATNKQVASALFLSPKTVEFHLGNAYRKLGVRNRTELAHRRPDLHE